MIVSWDQNQFPSSFAPFGDLLIARMFLSNLNGFNSSPSLPDQGFAKQKGFSKVWKEKWLQVILSLILSLPFLFFCFALLVCFALLFWVSLVLCIDLSCLTCFVWLFFSFASFCFSNKKKIEKSEKYKNSMCLYTFVLVYLGWPLKQSFLNFVSFVS